VSVGSLRRSVEADQYEWVVDDQVVAVLGYEERGSTILLLHTATDPALQDRGLVPSVRCPFVRAYLQQHPTPA
jgi:hypothetical protein